jgi:transcriptional regulator with XRE-family HTH domain
MSKGKAPGEKTREAAAFGMVLQRRRRERGQTQEALAEGAEIHAVYVSMMERGLRLPRLDVVVRVARALGLAPGELVDEYERALRKE